MAVSDVWQVCIDGRYEYGGFITKQIAEIYRKGLIADLKEKEAAQ